MRRLAAFLAAAALGACVTPPSSGPAAARSTPSPSPGEISLVNMRRSDILKGLGDGGLGGLLRADDLEGPLLAGVALEAYAEGNELKAVLFAQAALGADPGNGIRRRFLHAVASGTGIPFDPEGVLPPSALVQHELARAETAFFDRRFGAAAQFCRRALLIAPEDATAWTRLGSSLYAVGDEERAKQAYSRAVALKPGDKSLVKFMAERGWGSAGVSAGTQ